MPESVMPTDLPEWAMRQSAGFLSDLGDRWRHVRAVGERARQVSVILGEEDQGVLVAAAYLHDIGYAPVLRRTGAHQLDGAGWVRSQGYERLACLVAHHSQARFELELRELSEDLAAYPREESAVADALVYCDLTTGPAGQAMTLQERIDEVRSRYGPGTLVAEALDEATPDLRRAVERTEQRICEPGGSNQTASDTGRAAPAPAQRRPPRLATPAWSRPWGEDSGRVGGVWGR
ncbi:HDIG domain-containing protein [soil metagenome]